MLHHRRPTSVLFLTALLSNFVLDPVLAITCQVCETMTVTEFSCNNPSAQDCSKIDPDYNTCLNAIQWEADHVEDRTFRHLRDCGGFTGEAGCTTLYDGSKYCLCTDDLCNKGDPEGPPPPSSIKSGATGAVFGGAGSGILFVLGGIQVATFKMA